jgi:drug/metabolite transporter (DMT)-like permease
MCISGSMIIILNEKKSNVNRKLKEENNNEKEINHFGIFLGVILCLISVFFYAIINISSKILASHRCMPRSFPAM